MARATLTVQDVPSAGLDPVVYVAATADGHDVVYDVTGRTYLEAINAGGSDRTITIQTPATRDGLAVAERTVLVQDGETTHIPLGRPDYEQSDGTVYVDYDATTSLTVAALKLK